MRKIEQQMNTAIADQKDWQSANTRVENVDGVSYVYLHGHKIAEVGENFIVLYDGDHQTATTKSRLNAVLSENGLPGERVYQKDYVWNVRLSDGTSIPFFSGMRLNWQSSLLVYSNSQSLRYSLMGNINVATASKLDLLIADTQGQIKYTVLPTKAPKRSLLVMSQTKGLRTNTNRQGQSTPQAAIVWGSWHKLSEGL